MLQTVTASFMIIVEDDHDKWLPKDNGCTEVRDAIRCVRQLGCWLVGWLPPRLCSISVDSGAAQHHPGVSCVPAAAALGPSRTALL